MTMKQAMVSILMCLGGLWSAHAAAGAAGASVSTTNPVSQVSELLMMLQRQMEKEGKEEETLYEKFVCWGKQVIMQKKATNKAAEAESSELKQYISDLDNGRTELTSERVDLEKELSDILSSLEMAEATRKKEKTDFEEADAEMDQAITALTDAVDVLDTATKGHETGVFMAMKGEANHHQRFKSRAAEAESMRQAVKLGDKFLSKGDAVFLRRLLTGEVPTSDWKKLNRKATFKMSYKARSFKIQDLLAKMLDTFTKNKEEATAKEAESEELYGKLKASKEAERDATQTNLRNMDKENGAKTMSRSEAKARVDELDTQVTNDLKYIAQVEDSLKIKKDEWLARSTLRAGEIKAISEAIAILHSDSARDLFKRSLSSQGYLFLQTSQRSARSAAAKSAASVLRDAADQASDKRLARLARLVSSVERQGSPWADFKPVIDSIDKLVVILEDEQASDLLKKESCEQDRADDTRSAIKASRAIDDMSDAVTSAQAAIDQLKAELDENVKQLGEVREEMEAIKNQRAEENEAYLVAKKDDEDAAETVDHAKSVIMAFYEKEGLMTSFVQGAQNRSKEPVPVTAGEAPPPPPKTWEDPYSGKQGESTGLIAILKMIYEDIQRDMSKATDAEMKAVNAYDKLKATLMAEKSNLDEQMLTLTNEKSGKMDIKDDNLASRKLKKEELDSILESISAKEPGCNFFTVNFPVRSKNRQIEMDGLNKAKAILQGAKFDAPDPNREMEVGDALLQRARRH